MPADLTAAKAALAAGDKPQARALLMPIARSEPGNGEAWYLLAQMLEDPGQKQDCLNRAVANGYKPESDYAPLVQQGTAPHVIRSSQPTPPPQVVVVPTSAKPKRPRLVIALIGAALLLFIAGYFLYPVTFPGDPKELIIGTWSAADDPSLIVKYTDGFIVHSNLGSPVAIPYTIDGNMLTTGTNAPVQFTVTRDTLTITSPYGGKNVLNRISDTPDLTQAEGLQRRLAIIGSGLE